MSDQYKIVPITPSREHLISIALRIDHSFGLLSPEQQENTIRWASQLYEECIGEGFYKLDDTEQRRQNDFYNSLSNTKENK